MALFLHTFIQILLSFEEGHTHEVDNICENFFIILELKIRGHMSCRIITCLVFIVFMHLNLC